MQSTLSKCFSIYLIYHHRICLNSPSLESIFPLRTFDFSFKSGPDQPTTKALRISPLYCSKQGLIILRCQTFPGENGENESIPPSLQGGSIKRACSTHSLKYCWICARIPVYFYFVSCYSLPNGSQAFAHSGVLSPGGEKIQGKWGRINHFSGGPAFVCRQKMEIMSENVWKKEEMSLCYHQLTLITSQHCCNLQSKEVLVQHYLFVAAKMATLSFVEHVWIVTQ